MTLTTQQRAARRAKRFNNKTARELPLFAGTKAIEPFLVSQEQAEQQVKAWDESNEKYFAMLKDSDRQNLWRAAQIRYELSTLITTDELIAMDQKLTSLREHYPVAFSQPEYICDFWSCALRDLTK